MPAYTELPMEPICYVTPFQVSPYSEHHLACVITLYVPHPHQRYTRTDIKVLRDPEEVRPVLLRNQNHVLVGGGS